MYKVQDSNLLVLQDFYITITIRKEVVKSKLPYALFQETRNKNLNLESTELFVALATPQYFAVV